MPQSFVDAKSPSSSRLLNVLVTIAIFSTLINISTLSGLIRRKKSKLFRYLLIMAVVDLISCTVFSIQLVLNVICERPDLCDKNKALSLAWTKSITTELLLPSFSWINVLVESYITLQRFLSISSVTNTILVRIKNASVWKASLICCIISLSIHVHRFSTRTMSLKPRNMNKTRLWSSDFIRTDNAYGQTKLSTIIMTSILALQVLTISIVLFAINIITIFKLKSYLKRRNLDYSRFL